MRRVIAAYLLISSFHFAIAFDEIKVYPEPGDIEKVESVLWEKKAEIISCLKISGSSSYKISFIVRNKFKYYSCCSESTSIFKKLKFYSKKLLSWFSKDSEEGKNYSYFGNLLVSANEEFLDNNTRNEIYACFAKTSLSEISSELPLKHNLLILEVDLTKN